MTFFSFQAKPAFCGSSGASVPDNNRQGALAAGTDESPKKWTDPCDNSSGRDPGGLGVRLV